jgi:acyl-CoA reductase-like NAD-dependent aldehyde dehydrogenase
MIDGPGWRLAEQGENPDSAPHGWAAVVDPSRFAQAAGYVRITDAVVLDRAVEQAAAEQGAWAALAPETRAERLRAAAAAIEAEVPRLAPLLTREVGVTAPVASREISSAARVFRTMADHIVAMFGVTAPGPEGSLRVGRRPYGVVACIVPWNAPVVLTAQKIAPALAAGNAVVVKPSPFAPLGVTAMLEIVARELPGLVQVVNGGGEVGEALLRHPSIAKISFTGGGATARFIMRAAAERLVPVHLELGGNDPAIVLDDADLEGSARGIAASAFRRSGQICFAIKRVYVPRSRAAGFHDAMLAAVGELAVGSAHDPRTVMGPVNNAVQRDRIAGLADRTRAAGREVVDLGSRVDPSSWDDGYFLQPSLVLDAEHTDELVTVEQFGPILPIVSYDTEERALAMANDSEYGLGASVWSADVERAAALAQRLESGISFVNAHAQSEVAHRDMPFGGVKQSGMGWENSPAGIAEYLQFHSVDVHQTAGV